MKVIRTIFAAAAISPFLCIAACDLAKLREPDADASTVTAASIAPPAVTAPADTTAALATVAAPIATVAPAGAKHTGKTVKLPDGGTGAVVSLTDGGTAVIPTSADGGIPGLSGFTIPTALPSNLAIPSSIPRTLPSGFPTTLPSGFTMPTFPTATASH
jgi:hypothetical protein